MKKTFLLWLLIAIIIVFALGILVMKKLNAQNLSYVSQLNISGEWTFYLKIPSQPNVSVSYYHRKSVHSSTLVSFEQVGNILWIPNIGKGGMGYVDNRKVHFVYLVSLKKLLGLYTFNGIISKDEKSMQGNFTIKFYRHIIKGNWTATRKGG